jgi:hypothetical protein
VYQDVNFGGPAVTFWGYHLERAIGRMSRMLTDRNRTALNLVSNYMMLMASRNASNIQKDQLSRGFNATHDGKQLLDLFALHPDAVAPVPFAYPPLRMYARPSSPRKRILTVEECVSIASLFGPVENTIWEVTKATINDVVYKTVGVEEFMKTTRSFCCLIGKPYLVAKINKFILVNPDNPEKSMHLAHVEQFEVQRPNADSLVPRIYAGSGIFTWVNVCDLGMQLAIGKKLNEDACEYVIVPDVLNPLRPFDRLE